MFDSRQHLLIVEDDPVTCGTLAGYLRDSGYQVAEAGSGSACRRLLQRQGADLVLLDIGLPDCDGLQLAREIVTGGTAGLIFITSRSDEVDRVVGLELGGDDYLVKPFSFREALARVRAVLRRREAGRKIAPRQTVLGFGAWTIDLIRRELMDAAMRPVPLTRGEFDLLAALVEVRGRPLTRAYLGEVISKQGEIEIGERSVDALVARVRRKMGGNDESHRAIATLQGVGYKLGLDVHGR